MSDVEGAQTKSEPVFSNLPPGTALLAIGLFGIHLATSFLPQAQFFQLLDQFAIFPAKFGAAGFGGGLSGLDALQPLVGHAFFHGGWMHLAFNLALLLQVGGLAEAQLRRADRGGTPLGGAIRLVALFIVSAVGGGLAFIWMAPGPDSLVIGASGGISGLFAGYLWFAAAAARGSPGAMKSVAGQAGIFLALNVGGAALAAISGLAPIAWQAHLGGFVAGAIAFPLLARR
jgi:membrane associated rhomboid family serine protease